jgi:hypothetical protein
VDLLGSQPGAQRITTPIMVRRDLPRRRLAVIPGEVVEELHWAPSGQGHVGAVVVVVVQPARWGVQASLIAGVQPGIGPFGGQVRLKRSAFPLVWGRYGRVRRCWVPA